MDHFALSPRERDRRDSRHKESGKRGGERKVNGRAETELLISPIPLPAVRTAQDVLTLEEFLHKENPLFSEYTKEHRKCWVSCVETNYYKSPQEKACMECQSLFF